MATMPALCLPQHSDNSSVPPPAARTGFLESVASAISALGDALIDRAIELTLPLER